MIEMANSIIERTITIANDFKIEDAENIFKKNIDGEFEQIQTGMGIKLMDIPGRDVEDGIFIYFFEPLKLTIVQNLSSKTFDIKTEDAIEIISLSYIARYFVRLNTSHKTELQNIAVKMQEIIDRTKEAAG